MKQRVIWLVLAILWTGFIWSNSLQPAEVSIQTSGSVEKWVEPVLTSLGIPEEDRSFVVRKTAHLTEFALLGMLWLLFFRRRAWLGPCVWALCMCAATAIVDETIQIFVSGRGCELRDMTIDTLGAAVGISLLTALQLLIRKRRKTEKRSRDHYGKVSK